MMTNNDCDLIDEGLLRSKFASELITRSNDDGGDLKFLAVRSDDGADLILIGVRSDNNMLDDTDGILLNIPTFDLNDFGVRSDSKLYDTDGTVASDCCFKGGTSSFIAIYSFINFQ
jgi:hypothetical protein